MNERKTYYPLPSFLTLYVKREVLVEFLDKNNIALDFGRDYKQGESEKYFKEMSLDEIISYRNSLNILSHLCHYALLDIEKSSREGRASSYDNFIYYISFPLSYSDVERYFNDINYNDDYATRAYPKVITENLYKVKRILSRLSLLDEDYLTNCFKSEREIEMENVITYLQWCAHYQLPAILKCLDPFVRRDYRRDLTLSPLEELMHNPIFESFCLFSDAMCIGEKGESLKQVEALEVMRSFYSH